MNIFMQNAMPSGKADASGEKRMVESPETGMMKNPKG